MDLESLNRPIERQNVIENESTNWESAQSIRSKKIWSFVGLFIICLVVSLPIYSANAMATSLSVTSNTGNSNYEGYLNAEGDTWNLEATITDYESDFGETAISPDQVIAEIGSSQVEFNSCSASSGNTVCKFQSVLEDGIAEGTYSFDVVIYDMVEGSNSSDLGGMLASDSETITADGSEPSISISDIYQMDGNVYLDFTVEDQPDGLCSGLSEIEILDSETGTSLETISLSEEDWLGVCEFDYINDGDNAGVLSVELDGEGTRYIKVQATDFLGHTETSSAYSFATDFVAPVIQTGTLALLDFGAYVGEEIQASDVAINITECDEIADVTATSDDMEFYSQSADCDEIDDEECIWECIWEDISINADGSSVSAEITAVDEAGNSASSTVSSTFDLDSDAPEVIYFGSQYQYDDYSYVPADGDSVLYMQISESGSGIDEDSIALNLYAFGESDWQEPDVCENSTSGSYDYECQWEIDDAGTDGMTTTEEVNLRYVSDKVGNDGTLTSYEIIVDGVQPQITELEVYGFSAIGQKDYFQSNDDLVIEMTVTETSGLAVYVDVNDIVMDAENKYLYDDLKYGKNMTGWVEFDESSCSRDEETIDWECSFSVDSIKSGYDSHANFEVLIMDTAGNSANWEYLDSNDDAQNVIGGSEGEYSIELYALDEETQPDFWEQSSGSSTLNSAFVDLDIVGLTYPQIALTTSLRSDNDAKATLIELDECYPSEDETGYTPTISRSLLFGGSASGEPDSSPDLTIILEFESFAASEVVDLGALAEDGDDEFDGIDLEYTCQMRIYSVLDDTALSYAETQEIDLVIPFEYSEMGALDENVDLLMYEAVDKGWFRFLNVMGKIQKIINWIQWGGKIITAFMTLINVIDIIQIGFDKTRVLSSGGYFFASNACIVSNVGIKENLINFFDDFGVVFQILSCNPSPTKIDGGTGAATAVHNYQQGVLEIWKVAKGDWIGNAFADKIGDSGEKTASGEAWSDIVSITANTGSARLDDNIITSFIGLCIPGIFYQFDQMRQIECTYIKCLKENVANGITTVDICQKTKGYLYCKYILGEVMEMLPFDILTMGVQFLMNIVKNPTGVFFAVLNKLCSLEGCLLPVEGGLWVKICGFFGYFYKLLDIANDVVGVVQGFKVTQYDVCAEAGVQEMLDEVNANKAGEEEAESVTTDDLDSSSSDGDSSSSDSSGEDESSDSGDE